MTARTLRRAGLGISAAAVALLAFAAAWAFPPAQPYDPRPLLAQVEKKFTADKFTFVLLGDLQYSRDLPAVMKLADSFSPAFVLLTGDTVGGAATQAYDQIDREMGPFMRRVPTCPALGNHELSRQEGLGFYRQFHGFDAVRYSFDFRHARFITIMAPGGFHENRRELGFLEEKLAEGQKAGKLLFVWQHCPAYTVGIKRPGEVPGKPTDFTRLCTKYGVVADFAGHDHTYYRTVRDGVNYMVLAVSGPKCYPLNRRAEALPDDVYYGSAPKGATGGIFHTPAGEKAFPRGLRLMTVVDVDGPRVTGRTVSMTGEVMDQFVLSPRPLAETCPASQPAPQAPGPPPADSLPLQPQPTPAH